MTATYLAKLNAEQRRAVEHGCAALDEAPPLLIIAGAGSGKTNTLANRVAHLIVSGADPRRMMLLTFSRRAAAEMQRGSSASRQRCPARRPDRWYMRSIGRERFMPSARGFEYSLDIGLSNTFTIHDREDSADLMNLTSCEADIHQNGYPAAEEILLPNFAATHRVWTLPQVCPNTRNQFL
jgi:DNA helicase-2/ATP-dependent DNA helicase PcrA